MLGKSSLAEWNLSAGLFLAPGLSCDTAEHDKPHINGESQTAWNLNGSHLNTGKPETVLHHPPKRKADAEADRKDGEGCRNIWTDSPDGIPAVKLLDKLRWACLGPNFDWTNRRYLYDEPYRRMPSYLAQAAQRCANLASVADGKSFFHEAPPRAGLTSRDHLTKGLQRLTASANLATA